MIPTLPPSFIRLADGAYPIPAWHDPDPATHAEVFMEEPPEVPPGFIAELAAQPDAERILRYTVRPMTADEIRARVVVPQIVSRFQARAAMHIHGVLAEVEAEIQAADPIAQIAWADAQQFERPSPTIAAIAQKLGWTDQFVDELFITAGGITA